jgi:LysR family transcriptional regulator, nitrogen assimilation regulatory protein
MNLTQLAYFVRIADMGSFSKAALQLNIAQPALSRHIRLLETDLRTSLLQRTGRGVMLTDAGKRLYAHSINILQLVSHAREDLDANRNEPTGRIVIGLPPSMGRLLTLPLVDRFKLSFPKARLAIVEGLSAHLTEWIATGRLDLALVHASGVNSAVDTTPLLEEPLCVISAARKGKRDTPSKAQPKLLSFSDLGKLALVVPEPNHAMRKLLDTHAALAGVKLNIAYEVSSVQSILELVRHGHGHAVLGRSAVLASPNPDQFSVCALEGAPLKSTLCLAVSAHRPSTPLVKLAARTLHELLLTKTAAMLAP